MAHWTKRSRYQQPKPQNEWSFAKMLCVNRGMKAPAHGRKSNNFVNAHRIGIKIFVFGHRGTHGHPAVSRSACRHYVRQKLAMDFRTARSGGWNKNPMTLVVGVSICKHSRQCNKNPISLAVGMLKLFYSCGFLIRHTNSKKYFSWRQYGGSFLF